MQFSAYARAVQTRSRLATRSARARGSGGSRRESLSAASSSDSSSRRSSSGFFLLRDGDAEVARLAEDRHPWKAAANSVTPTAAAMEAPTSSKNAMWVDVRHLPRLPSPASTEAR